MASDESDEDPVNKISCSKCHEAYNDFDEISTEPDTLWIHIEAGLLKAKQKDKTNKKKILHILKKKVCALRNSRGGYLLIHLNGKSANISYLGTFDEAVEHPLKALISDGSLLIENYKRQWMSEFPKCSKYTDFIVLTVLKSATVSTVDYNTKIPTDLQIEDPTFFNFKKLLSDNSYQTDEEPSLRGYDITDLDECRSVQLKAYYGEVIDLSTLSNRIWKEYRFREYFSAMTKVKDGGSYYLGIKEGNDKDRPILKGFILPEGITEKDIERAIQEKLREDVVFLSSNGVFESASHNLIKIGFHHLKNGGIVLQIAVKYMPGFAFYRKGPRSYKILTEENSKVLKEMDKEEWKKQLFNDLYNWSPLRETKKP